MSDNKAMIRFYAILLVVSAVLTYMVDLNAQFGFIRANSLFISNSFCFAIISGILTGVVVALAAEIRQYLLHKRDAINVLYSIASELYALISAQKASIKYYINNINASIPENIGGDFARQPILVRSAQLKIIDYVPFSKNDDIRLALKGFMKQLDTIENAVRNLVDLQIAYNQTKISFNEKYDNQSKVTSESSIMLDVLKEKYCVMKECLEVLNDFCSEFEKIDRKHFKWESGKKAIDDISIKIEKNAYYIPNHKA